MRGKKGQGWKYWLTGAIIVLAFLAFALIFIGDIGDRLKEEVARLLQSLFGF